jgi:glutathione S-transferase
MAPMPTLYIGNKNYSSWSLRPWLALRWAGIAFDEVLLPLGGDGYGRGRIPAIRAVSPTGRVPVLVVDGVAIADSLAICEWAAEVNPSLLPTDRLERARCRSTISEMHSSFSALRRDLSMNLRRRTRGHPWPADTADDIARMFESWHDALHRSGGPWLFGTRTLADAFYAPVVTRFRSYGVELPDACAAYSATLLADPGFRSWEEAALLEPWVIESTEALWRD